MDYKLSFSEPEVLAILRQQLIGRYQKELSDQLNAAFFPGDTESGKPAGLIYALVRDVISVSTTSDRLRTDIENQLTKMFDNILARRIDVIATEYMKSPDMVAMFNERIKVAVDSRFESVVEPIVIAAMEKSATSHAPAIADALINPAVPGNLSQQLTTGA